MAMRRSNAGGGLGSSVVVQKPVRTGSGSASTRPAGVAQIGQAWGDHASDAKNANTGYRGERLHNPDRNFQPVKFGNEVALNVGAGGPGTGRTVMRSGSQSTHGPVDSGNPRPNPMHDALENQ
jgi:hypothetical protein